MSRTPFRRGPASPRAARLRSAAAALVVAACAAPAFAKSPAQAPTLEDLRARAQQAEAEAHKKALEAQRDPRKDACEAYKDKKRTELKDYQALVDILLDAKTPEVQDYRPMAAEALTKRFEQEDVDRDPAVRQVRREIGLELVELLGASPKDDKGLLAAEQIYYAWYRGQLVQNHWKREAKQSDRVKAMRKIRDFLKRGND